MYGNSQRLRLDDVLVIRHHGSVLAPKVHPNDMRLESLCTCHLFGDDLVVIVIALDQLIAGSESPRVGGAFRIKASTHGETRGGPLDALPVQSIHGFERRASAIRADIGVFLSETAVRWPPAGEERALVGGRAQEECMVLSMR